MNRSLKKRQRPNTIQILWIVKNIAGQVLTYNWKNFHWVNRKLDRQRTMNGLGKLFRKKSNPKKNSKNQSQIAACEQKTTSEKANFCSNTVFSLYFKIRAEKFHATKPLAFSLHFLFRRDHNHYSNLTSKIMKMCEQILKNERPNTFQILSIVKILWIVIKTKRRPIIAPAIAVRLIITVF